MRDDPTFNDIEVHERLVGAEMQLPAPHQCETEHARTAVEAARKALAQLQIALLHASEASSSSGWLLDKLRSATSERPPSEKK